MSAAASDGDSCSCGARHGPRERFYVTMVDADNTARVAFLAGPFRQHRDAEDSARLCLADAVRLYDAGDLDAARTRALRSLMYSVGSLSDVYERASK